MGSLRNPIGPLPSSIYWRRRAVALAVLALMALVLIWVFVSGDGKDGSRDEGKGGDGNGPASTITPGPTDSGPAISERPGGRDEEDGDSGGSGGSGGSAGSGDSEADEQSTAGGTGWGAGSAAGGGTGADGDAGSGSGGSGGAGKAGAPAAPGLADCGKSDVKLVLRSLKKKYGPGEKPKFELKADNDRGSACKIDLGRTATVVTINNPDDAKFWASDDCPPTKKPLLRQVPANGASTHTLTWLRKASAANCGTPTFDAPRSGTYEIEVQVKGLKTVRTTFELEK